MAFEYRQNLPVKRRVRHGVPDPMLDLDIHPFMLSRWRREAREGRLRAPSGLSQNRQKTGKNAPLTPPRQVWQDEVAMPEMKMLILRGIAGHYAGRDWPRGALDEPSALEYARRKGYVGQVLDVAGATGPKSPQTLMALAEFRRDETVTALYGFSGGGYNVLHIIKALNNTERARIQLVVVLGAPKNPSNLYKGPWELVYRVDPPGGHMDGPRALLASLQ